jgi:hyperosmotically inducible periplasmic protein
MERMLMKILRTVMLMTVMLSAVGLTACGRQGSGPAETAGKNIDQAAQTAGNAVDNAAANTGQALTDTAITSKVKAAIFAEPGLKTLQIDVETNNGMVTLTGTVNSQENSDKAVAIARNVDGVKGVSNRLTVVPDGSG